MPVFHEKTERSSRTVETGRRETSMNRSKQREVSVERKPIITQEKPPTRRLAPSNLSHEVSTGKRAAGRISKNSDIKKSTSKNVPAKPTVSQPYSGGGSIPTKTNVAKKTNVQTKAKIGLDPTTSTSRKVTPKVSPRATENIRKSSRNVDKGLIISEKLPSKVKKPEQATTKEIRVNFPETKTEGNHRNHDRTRTRTLSPSEVKFLPIKTEKSRENSPSNDSKKNGVKDYMMVKNDETQLLLENNNIVGKGGDGIGYTEGHKNDDDDDSTEKDVDYDYEEDDFEDYESDFEDDESEELEQIAVEKTNEVEKMFSPRRGTSGRKRVMFTSAESKEEKPNSESSHIIGDAYKSEIEEIKTAMQNENRQLREMSVPENGDQINPEATPTRENFVKARQSIDFSKAGIRNKEQEHLEKAKRRGQELSQMITLDTITYTLLDISPVPYEEFMSTYGKSNTSQVHAQTNEDNCEDETQTEDIDVIGRWTQAPPAFAKYENKDGKTIYRFLKEERLGVGSIGGDNISNDNEDSQSATVLRTNNSQLQNFLGSASQKILVWLECRDQLSASTGQRPSDLTCCQEMFIMNQTDKSVTEERSSITFTATSNHHLVLTVEKVASSEYVIKVWTVLAPSTPLNVLLCHQEVTCACFSPGRGDIVFAGGRDGSLNVWDLREKIEVHTSATWELRRSPTYSTAEVLKNESHLTPVVAVITLNQDEQYEEFIPIKVCSLDEMGEVVLWSMVQQNLHNRILPNDDLGLAPWGRVRLVKNSSFNPSHLVSDGDQGLLPTDRYYAIISRDPLAHELLLASSSGRILHCSVDGSLLKPKYYVPSKNARPSAVTTITVYPVDDRYFLAGCSDGTIRLHNKDQDIPLINLHWNLADASPVSSIKAINWFPNRPCMFYVLDQKSRVHVWNLTASDIYPQFTSPASTFTCTAILKPKNLSQAGSMVFGKQNGQVEVHSINYEYDSTKSKEEYKKEMKMFQRYVNIL